MIPPEFRQVALLVNEGKSTKRLYLAPWGEAYELAPGAEVEVYARGEGNGFRVDVAEGHITAWGWPESVLVVAREGVPLDGEAAWERPRVPPVPPGVDAREFLELIRPAVDDEDEMGG